MTEGRLRVEIPVHVDGLGMQTITGWLAMPPDQSKNCLQLLVHGAVCSHDYWDLRYKPEVYSYTEFAFANHCSTLAIDQLGVGESAHPPGADVTFPALAQALHGVVSHLRTARLAGHVWDRIVVVGHSAGSYTAGLEETLYHDVDAVVLTGLLGPNVNGMSDSDPAILAHYIPARSDPILAGRRELDDPNYLTLKPGRRARMFFRQPPAEPDVVAIDESQKEIMTTGQWETFKVAADACGHIRCPTLVVNGRYDRFFYSSASEPDISSSIARAQAAAPAHYTFAPLFDGMGHNLNYHPGARDVYRTIQDWIRSLPSHR